MSEGVRQLNVHVPWSDANVVQKSFEQRQRGITLLPLDSIGNLCYSIRLNCYEEWNDQKSIQLVRNLNELFDVETRNLRIKFQQHYGIFNK